MPGVSLEPGRPNQAGPDPAALAVAGPLSLSLPAARSPHLGPATLAGCHSGGRRWRRESAKVHACGQYQGRWTCPHCGKVYAVVSHCRSRFCAHCARARSMVWLHKVNPDAFRYPMLLTLTLPAGPDGKGLVSLILRAFRRWRRALNVRRYLYAVEVRPHALGYYVHLHALVDCVWLNLDAARGLWRSLTGATVLDVQRVSQSTGGKRSAVREVVKYVTKSPDALTPEEVDALGRATRGRRLVAARGCCLSRLDTFKETSEPTEAGKSGGLLCPDCRCPLRFDRFERRQRPEAPDALPEYDFHVLDAATLALVDAPARAGPPAVAESLRTGAVTAVALAPAVLTA